ncbi:sigma-70 family RNA polymerase sigma factor [Pedobacter sp. MC2016-14]|uniref:RNA polymerase sigma factor n=1 Tax=Pedobacter sp. MC2016-14 TaxID=2897327 RepID=UPI001E3DF338|nr:sigma-70 family RNA polymerase sigma factor [Pedobacter sp. MC2016-14]
MNTKLVTSYTLPLSNQLNNTSILSFLQGLLPVFDKEQYLEQLPAQIKSPELAPEAELVKALRAGDRKAYALLYKNYSAALFGIISRIVKSVEAAEDVQQETFVKIFKCIKEYDPEKGRLFTWMAKIARNKSIDNLRSKTESNTIKNDVLEDVISSVNQLHRIHFNIETIGIKQLTQQLPAHQKEIIDLIYFGGFTHTEAAEALNIPLGTIKTHLRNAIITLRKSFNHRR